MRSLFLLLLLLMSYGSFAQEEVSTDNNIIGGSFFFKANKNGEVSSTLILTPANPVSILGENSTLINFSINPYYARKISESWILGLVVGYNHTKLERNTQNNFPQFVEITTDAFNFGVFGRYTFYPQNKFSLFVQPGLNYTQADRTIFLDDDKVEHTRANSIDILARPGAAFKLGYNFQLIATFGEIGASFGKEKELAGFISTVDFSSFYTDFGFSSFRLGAELRF
jgi:hypothetical protein